MQTIRKTLTIGVFSLIILVGLMLQGCGSDGTNPGKPNVPSLPTSAPGTAPGVFHQAQGSYWAAAAKK